MLPQEHSIAFNDIKSKHFLKPVEGHQPVTQETGQDPHLICAHVLWNYFGVGILEQTSCSASIDRVLVYIRSV